MRISDWSSDVCSSDLTGLALGLPRFRGLANPFQLLVNGLLTARFFALFLRHALGLRLQPRAVIALERNTAAPVELKHPAHDIVEEVAVVGNKDDVAGVIDEVIFQPLHAFSRSEEHTSELQSLMRISYAVFCLIKT